jgi:ABC-type dipeptide/oligopeptide/nickel transport system ATPase component
VSVLLEVKNLKTGFKTDDGSFLAVDDVSFVLEKGKTLGIVGESGSGKSVTALSRCPKRTCEKSAATTSR